ncbi:MAG: hypothetical protein ABH854_03255 [Candidatus Diapherotrites archaeon]
MNFKHLLVAIAMLFIVSYASAGWAFGYYDDDWSVEVYHGGAWTAHYEPHYHYYHDGYYYYNNDFRVYYGGYYNYFDAGWYGSNRYWYKDNTEGYGQRYWYGENYGYHYTPYYAPNYYYYGGTWVNYGNPNWISYYGYNYYGSAYYSGAADYTYYGPVSGSAFGSAGYGYGDSTGYAYKYPQEGFCHDISLGANDVYITAGDDAEVTVNIKNSAYRNFDVESVSLHIDGFDVKQTSVKYDEEIKGYGSGSARFKIEARADAKTESINATVRVSGVFTDGTNCSPSDIGAAEFEIRVSGKSKRERDEGTDYSYSTASYRGDSGNYWQESAGEYVSEDYKEPKEESYKPGGNCSALGFENKTNPAGINVEAGEQVYDEIYLKNYSALRFYIDSVDVEEYSAAFSAGGHVKDSVVLPEDRARAGFWVNAHNSEAGNTGQIKVKVNGHFSDGLYCGIESNALPVYVKGGKQDNYWAFKFDAPTKIELEEGGNAYLKITIDNPTDEDAVVTLVGEDVVASPATINIPPHTLAERTIKVSNGGAEGKGYVFYKVYAGNVKVSEKFTKVLFVEGGNGNGNSDWEESGWEDYDNGNEDNGNSAEGAGSTGTEGTGNEGSGSGTDFTAMAGTAFAVLSGNAINIGLLMLIFIMLWMIYRAVSGNRVRRPARVSSRV